MSRRCVPMAGELVLVRLREELERLFQEILVAGDSLPGEGTWNPPVDILERSDDVLVVAEVPGLMPESLAVEIEGATLILSGQRRPAYGDGLRFHCLERTEGSFSRRIQIFAAVDTRAAEAELSRGLLRIRLPKVQERRKRRRRLSVSEPEESP